MSDACDAYLDEMLLEGTEESRAIHEVPGSGWYSEAVMAYALRAKQNIYMLDLDNPIRVHNADDPMRLYSPDVRGVIVNMNQTHWMAFRFLGDSIWHLDSRYSPRVTTYDAYTRFLKEYRNAFVLRAID